jgi:hypothetical protein
MVCTFIEYLEIWCIILLSSINMFLNIILLAEHSRSDNMYIVETYWWINASLQLLQWHSDSISQVHAGWWHHIHFWFTELRLFCMRHWWSCLRSLPFQKVRNWSITFRVVPLLSLLMSKSSIALSTVAGHLNRSPFLVHFRACHPSKNSIHSTLNQCLKLFTYCTWECNTTTMDVPDVSIVWPYWCQKVQKHPDISIHFQRQQNDSNRDSLHWVLQIPLEWVFTGDENWH